jgi:UDP:flavonoid glycosyltransferase YjiC (YdhE family)
LTAEGLAAAIREATGDPDMRRRAAELGAKIRAEDGVSAAARLINRYVSAS